MEFNPDLFDTANAVRHWLTVVAVLAAVFLVGALLLSLLTRGAKGVSLFGAAVIVSMKDLLGISLKRVLAITRLTFKEAVRRKALMIFVVFCILFMFAGWFLAGSNNRAHTQVKLYVSFVLTAITWLLLTIMLLLSCWGIPEDIRLRSLHTVVTKPTRRIEIVLGRILGFTTIGLLVLTIMGGAGYLWIRRQLNDEQQKVLTSRVPVYGPLEFLGDTGRPEIAGVNVGDVWKHRSYVKGASAARAIWNFEGVTEDRLRRKAAFVSGDIPEGESAEITEWLKKPGDELQSGELVARMNVGGREIVLNAPHYGKLVSISRDVGDVVTSADPLIVMEYSSAKLESNFEAFRTFKGDMELGGLVAQYILVNNRRAEAFADIAKSNNFAPAANELRLARYQNAADLLETLGLKLEATLNFEASREVTFVTGELEDLSKAFDRASTEISNLKSASGEEWVNEISAAFDDCALAASDIAELEGVEGDFSSLGKVVRALSQSIKDHQASMRQHLTRLAVPLESVIVREYRFGENILDVPRKIPFTANNEDLVHFLSKHLTELSESNQLVKDGQLTDSLVGVLGESKLLVGDAPIQAATLLKDLVDADKLKIEGDQIVPTEGSMFEVLSDSAAEGKLTADDNWSMNADLFSDVVNGDKLRIEVACLSAGQYLGMAKPDLFIRLPDRPFESGYVKALAVIGMVMALIVTIGVCASCFVKGPVAIFLTLTVLMIGQPFSYKFLSDLVNKQIKGSGVIESVVRMITQKGQDEDLGVSERMGSFIETFDNGFRYMLGLIQNVIPKLEPFGQASGYIENGFDVPFYECVLPALLTLFGVALPCIVIGYVTLRFRELEAK